MALLSLNVEAVRGEQIPLRKMLRAPHVLLYYLLHCEFVAYITCKT